MVTGRRGYTLTEAMLSVAIIAILGSVGARVFLQANRYFIMTNTRAELQREARTVMYVVNRNLRQAQSSTIVIDRASSQPFYSRITFTKIQGGSALSFYQSGTTLVQKSGTQTQILSKNVKYLAFAFPRSDEMDIVSVALTLEKSIFQGRTKALHMASEKVRVMN